MAANMGYLTRFFSFVCKLDISSLWAILITSAEIPCDGTSLQLLRITECASEANPSVVTHKIKGGSEHICKTVHDSVFGSISFKQVEDLRALEIYCEIKQIYSNI